jgi:hypothetical protein
MIFDLRTVRTPSIAAAFRRAAAVAVATALLGGAGEARAASSCTPPPLGIIGMPGPPDWSSGTYTIDDPRWHGARQETFPDLLAGGTPDSAVRLVQSGGTLFVQFQTLADATPGNSTTAGSPAVTSYRDSIYLGFADSSLGTINMVRIAINTTVSPPVSIFRWQKSGGTWTSSFGAPTWLTAHTAWTSGTVSGLSVPWGVYLKINTGAVPGTKFWYGTSISPGGFGSVQTYAWPDRGGFIEPDPPDTSATAATWGAAFDTIGSANWGDYTAIAGTLPLPAGCGGVRIESDDITTNHTPNYTISTNQANTFSAQLSGTLPAANAVRARFRLANWGMTIGVGATWADIPGGSYADDRKNNASGLISFACPNPVPCPPIPSGNSDQCMLVELQAAAGAVSFSKDSAWRNMIFGTTSKFEHDAEISLAGLPPEPTPRDVYIYIQTHNMPAKMDPQRQYNSEPNIEVAMKQDPNLRYKLEGMNAAERRIVMGGPVYEARGYRDTGKGKPGWQLLEPMVPFGYMIQHNGVLYGWNTELVGVGTTVTTIIPNVLYKISVIPGGKATIKTKIEAREGPGGVVEPVKPCPHCCCDIAQRETRTGYLAMAAVAVIATASRRRGRKSAARARN